MRYVCVCVVFVSSRTGVARWFQGGLSASTFGVGKPDARIFHAACATVGVAPRHVLHVGDDLVLDVHAALAAGLQACWLRRAAATGAAPGGEPPPGSVSVATLTALADALKC